MLDPKDPNPRPQPKRWTVKELRFATYLFIHSNKVLRDQDIADKFLWNIGLLMMALIPASMFNAPQTGKLELNLK